MRRIAALILLVASCNLGLGCTAIERNLELHGFIHKLTPKHTGKSVQVSTRPITAITRSPRWPKRNKAKISMGRGAVIAKDIILTVEHVVTDDDGKLLKHVWIDPYGRGRNWLKATVEACIPSEPEAVAVLRVPLNEPCWFLGFPGFDTDDYYKRSTLGVAHVMETKRGPYTWVPDSTVKGDSGSPVVDKNGHLVGLVWGSHGDRPVYVWLPESAFLLAE